ncbi:hypothetical protein, partial [Planotetraspora phitsanulokensis]
MTAGKGPRFKIASTHAAGPSVVDELVGRVPVQRPEPTPADGEVVGTIVQPAAAPVVAKFGNADEPPTLEECEQHIRTITTQWLLGVGLALRAIRDHELFKTAGYDSFTSYVRHRQPLGMKPPQVTRVIQSIPVVEALENRTDREINEGQARVLVPVLEHGAQAVQEVWDAAANSGHPSARALAEIARKKGYLKGEDPNGGSDDPPPPPPSGTSAVLVRYQRALSAFDDLRGLRNLAKEEPDAARHIAAKL